MSKATFILARVFLLFLIINLIDGGKCLSVISANVHHIIVHEPHKDLEVNNLSSASDETKWLDDSINKMDLSFPFTLAILSVLGQKPVDYSESVWQPPKSL